MVIDNLTDWLRGYLPAAAFAAAVELGLFWHLAEAPQPAAKIAATFGIPPRRCRIWLELLVGLGLLDRQGTMYVPSARTRTEILDTYSRETWHYLAQEARERDLAGHDLVRHLAYPGSVWAAQGHPTPNYVAQMGDDPARARQFTYASHDLNRAAADELAQMLDLSGARRLLDLGGGSGVMALALLHHYPDLTATVVDIENVCAVGREIAAGVLEGERLDFHPADLGHDPLPEGFDVVLFCKVGIYDVALYGKAVRSLTPGGRLVVVDKLVGEGVGEPLSGLIYAFLSSLQDPDFYLISVKEVCARLVEAGLQVIAVRSLATDETVIEARAQT